jgi:hypothetical protein
MRLSDVDDNDVLVLNHLSGFGDGDSVKGLPLVFRGHVLSSDRNTLLYNGELHAQP